MMRLVGKLLVLIAMLAMPLGMSAAGANAPSAHDTVMDKAHCPDSAPAADVEPGIAACNMVCAAALPAIAPGALGLSLLAAVPAPVRAMSIPAGVLLEIATPPPRTA